MAESRPQRGKTYARFSVREDQYTARCEHPVWLPGEPRFNPVDHEAWRNQMREAHEQRRCPHCKLWVLWEPKA